MGSGPTANALSPSAASLPGDLLTGQGSDGNVSVAVRLS